MRTWYWVLGIAVSAGAVWWWYESGFIYTYKTDIARSPSAALVNACEAYRLKNLAGGKYPARLSDLVAPPEGMKPILEGGPAAITDPWGEEYKYALVEGEHGPVPYVWFEHEFGGRLHLVGARRRSGGKSYFGPDEH